MAHLNIVEVIHNLDPKYLTFVRATSGAFCDPEP